MQTRKEMNLIFFFNEGEYWNRLLDDSSLFDYSQVIRSLDFLLGTVLYKTIFISSLL